MNLIIAIFIVAFIGAIPLSINEYYHHKAKMKEIEEIMRKVINEELEELKDENNT